MRGSGSMQQAVKALGVLLFGVLACVWLVCAEAGAANQPSIRITRVPAGDPAGGSDKMGTIEGVVRDAAPQAYKVLLYARTNTWWVQPFADAPYTTIGADGKWRANTHLGAEYAALLVRRSHSDPPAQTLTLPEEGVIVGDQKEGSSRAK